jgi:hypothetical protein
MTPQELSAEIRRIASGIENSKKPSRELVAADIKRLLNHLATSGAADPVVAEAKGSAAAKPSAGAKDSEQVKEEMRVVYSGGKWHVFVDGDKHDYYNESMEEAVKLAAAKHAWIKRRLNMGGSGAA